MDQAWKSINGFFVSFTSSFRSVKDLILDRNYKEKNEKVVLEKNE